MRTEEFFPAEGWPMLVVLALGLGTFIHAALFVRRPAERHIGSMRALSTATVFGILTGIVSDLAGGVHPRAQPGIRLQPRHAAQGLRRAETSALETVFAATAGVLIH